MSFYLTCRFQSQRPVALDAGLRRWTSVTCCTVTRCTVVLQQLGAVSPTSPPLKLHKRPILQVIRCCIIYTWTYTHSIDRFICFCVFLFYRRKRASSLQAEKHRRLWVLPQDGLTALSPSFHLHLTLYSSVSAREGHLHPYVHDQREPAGHWQEILSKRRMWVSEKKHGNKMLSIIKVKWSDHTVICELTVCPPGHTHTSTEFPSASLSQSTWESRCWWSKHCPLYDVASEGL